MGDVGEIEVDEGVAASGVGLQLHLVEGRHDDHFLLRDGLGLRAQGHERHHDPRCVKGDDMVRTAADELTVEEARVGRKPFEVPVEKNQPSKSIETILS